MAAGFTAAPVLSQLHAVWFPDDGPLVEAYPGDTVGMKYQRRRNLLLSRIMAEFNSRTRLNWKNFLNTWDKLLEPIIKEYFYPSLYVY